MHRWWWLVYLRRSYRRRACRARCALFPCLFPRRINKAINCAIARACVSTRISISAASGSRPPDRQPAGDQHKFMSIRDNKINHSACVDMCVCVCSATGRLTLCTYSGWLADLESKRGVQCTRVHCGGGGGGGGRSPESGSAGARALARAQICFS